jgi:PAS fold
VVSRILRDVPQPIWVVDAAGRISFANPAAVTLAPGLTGHAAHGEDGFFVRRNGSLFPIAWWSSPIDLPSGRGVVVAFTDPRRRPSVRVSPTTA